MLVRLGTPLGRAIDGPMSTVTPKTVARWASGGTFAGAGPSAPIQPPRRPPVRRSIADLVRRMASETDGGYTRTHLELQRLGIADIVRSSASNHLRAGHGPGGSPQDSSTWDQFIRADADIPGRAMLSVARSRRRAASSSTSFSCSFISVRVASSCGAQPASPARGGWPSRRDDSMSRSPRSATHPLPRRSRAVPCHHATRSVPSPCAHACRRRTHMPTAGFDSQSHRATTTARSRASSTRCSGSRSSGRIRFRSSPRTSMRSPSNGCRRSSESAATTSSSSAVCLGSI